jgi:competence protein ComEC
MPFLVATLVLAGLVLGALPLPWAARGLAMALLGAGGWWWGGRLGTPPLTRLALLALVPALLLWGLWRQPHPGPDDPVRLLPAGGTAPAQLRGSLQSDPRPVGEEGGCAVVLQLQGGASELRIPRCPTLQQGWTVEATGTLRRPARGAHPLLNGPAERLERGGIWSQLKVESLKVLERPATPVADLRRRMASALLRHGGAERGGVLAALVLGSAVVPLPLDVREAFRAAGLSHALAASGFHLSVLLGAVLAVGRRLPRPLRCALAAGAMLLFLFLAGPQPSVVRAVLMGAVAFAVLESGGRSRPLGVLLLSVVVMLLVQPAWLLDVGFQLSVAATAGLMLTARDLEGALAARLPAWAATGLAVPLAASLWTLPLQLLHFGVVPLYAVPSNLVVSPLLTPLTLGAMGLALAAVLLPPLVPLLAWPLAQLTGLLLLIVRGFAALPMAQWQLGRPLPALVLLFALALLPWLLPARRRLRLLGTVGLGLSLALHLVLLGADQLLLIHQWNGDLLLARHQGRGALVSTSADSPACADAARLAAGLGLQRFDWISLLDPVAASQPECWQRQANLLLAASDGRIPLRPGQRLESPGLALQPISADSRAFRLDFGRQHWLLLPDRQSLAAWEQGGPESVEPSGIWLGYRPRPRERLALEAARPLRLWVSGEWPTPPPGWQVSGPSGALQVGPG